MEFPVPKEEIPLTCMVSVEHVSVVPQRNAEHESSNDDAGGYRHVGAYFLRDAK